MAFSTESWYNELSFNEVLRNIFTRRPAHCTKSRRNFYENHPVRIFLCHLQASQYYSGSKRTYVTQPAISSGIRELEKEFSINLFVRSKNHVTLTKEGELFYQKAQDMLRYIKESSSELHDLGRQTPPVRIGIPPLLSTVYFPDIYVEFSKIHPEIHLELFEYGSIRAASLVNEEALDVSLVNMDFYDIDK